MNEPAGLDQFIASDPAASVPAGLDEFVAPQLEKEKYSGIIPTLKAAALEAARVPSFGTSDIAFTKLGITTPEEARALKEQHPYASIGGGLLGLGLSLAAPETGLLGALSAPVKAVSELGGAVTEAATIPASSVIGQIVSRGAALGAGSAIEGAAYGLGQSVSEHALGDPDLNAEKVGSNVLNGMLFGGVLGAGLGAAEVAIPASVSSAKNALNKLYDVSVGLPGKEPGVLGKTYAEASSFVSGKPYDQIIDAMQNRVKSLVKPEEQKEVISEFADGLKDQHSKVSKALYDANKSVRLEESANYLKDIPGDVALPEMTKTVAQLKNTIQEMRAEPDLYPGAYPRILEQVTDRVSKEVGSESSAFDVFKSLNDLKSRLDEEIQYGAAPSGGDLRAQNLIGNIRRSIKNTLEEPSIWGEAASRQAAFNDAQSQFLNLVGKKGVFRSSFMGPALGKGGKLAYEVSPAKVETYLKQISSLRGEAKSQALKSYLEVSDNLVNEIEKSYQALPDKAFDKSGIQAVLEKNRDISNKAIEQSEFNKALNALSGGAHNVQFGEGAAASTAILGHPVAAAALETAAMLKAPGLAIQRLAKIERLVQQTTRAIDRGVSQIFKGAAQAGEKTAGFIGSQIDLEKKDKKYKNVTTQLNDLTNNPEKLLSQLEQSTQNLHNYAPKISQGLQMTGARAVQFLQSKIPGQDVNKRPLSDPYKPSDTELSKWHKYFSIIEEPTRALDQVAKGNLTPETMETLKIVYPKLLHDMQIKVTDGMINAVQKKKPIPYKTKLTLSMFLGQDLVSSLDPKVILSNQNIMTNASQAKALQEHAQMSGANKKSISKMEKSNRLLTPMQEAAERKEV